MSANAAGAGMQLAQHRRVTSIAPRRIGRCCVIIRGYVLSVSLAQMMILGMTMKNIRRFIIASKQVRSRAAAEVAAIKGEDGLEVVIQPHVDNQTAEQRGFFHVLVKIMADELGYSPNAMKQAIKVETWGSEMVEVCEMTVEVVRSSGGAKRDEYSELIETTFRLAADHGIVLPNPRWKE